MYQDLNYFAKRLGKSPGSSPDVLAETSPDVFTSISALVDNNHSIVLRGVLDSLETASGSDLPARASATLATAEKKFTWLRTENSRRFSEFRERWEKRLVPGLLLPVLRHNQWIIQDLEGYHLAGKGTPKELKNLYIQCLHDMAADCERQVSAMGGHINHLQASLASSWYEESIHGNLTRLLPVFEASVRGAEFEAFRQIRISMGSMIQEKFIQGFSQWTGGPYLSEAELVEKAASPFAKPGGSPNGFIGFMRLTTAFGERLTEVMVDHFQDKWRLLLSGLPFREIQRGGNVGDSMQGK